MSSEAGLLKYERDAAWMPIACLPPFVPYGTELRYFVRIHALPALPEWTFSSSSASLASRILRFSDFSRSSV